MVPPHGFLLSLEFSGFELAFEFNSSSSAKRIPRADNVRSVRVFARIEVPEKIEHFVSVAARAKHNENTNCNWSPPKGSRLKGPIGKDIKETDGCGDDEGY